MCKYIESKLLFIPRLRQKRQSKHVQSKIWGIKFIKSVNTTKILVYCVAAKIMEMAYFKSVIRDVLYMVSHKYYPSIVFEQPEQLRVGELSLVHVVMVI